MEGGKRNSMLHKIGQFVSGRGSGAARGLSFPEPAVLGREAEAADKAEAASGLAKVVREEVAQVKGFRWLRIKKTFYRDRKGQTREWETAERTTHRDGRPDAVFVIAFLEHEGRDKEMLLVSQFRPCVDAVCLELPAGLVDDGESPGEAALRELKEETGYVGEVLSTSPDIPIDAGMTNSSMVYVRVRVDMSLPENQTPKQQLEDDEDIKIHLVERSKLMDTCANPEAVLPGVGAKVDSRLYSVVFGMASDM